MKVNSSPASRPKAGRYSWGLPASQPLAVRWWSMASPKVRSSWTGLMRSYSLNGISARGGGDVDLAGDGCGDQCLTPFGQKRSLLHDAVDQFVDSAVLLADAVHGRPLLLQGRKWNFQRLQVGNVDRFVRRPHSQSAEQIRPHGAEGP